MFQKGTNVRKNRIFGNYRKQRGKLTTNRNEKEKNIFNLYSFHIFKQHNYKAIKFKIEQHTW